MCKTKKSKLLLSFRVQVCHPHTRDRGRLLGPCFKTGRIKPFSHCPRAAILRLLADWNRAVQNSTEPSPQVQRIENHPRSYIGLTVSNRHYETPQRICNKRKILPEDPMYNSNSPQETLLTSSSNSHPCGMVIHRGQQQSCGKKLVSFASLLAISGTFNSLSKVLFIFPSRYLFAIGLRPIFSFRRKLPPILRTTSKVRDSKKPCRMDRTLHVDGILTLSDAFFQKDLRGDQP